MRSFLGRMVGAQALKKPQAQTALLVLRQTGGERVSPATRLQPAEMANASPAPTIPTVRTSGKTTRIQSARKIFANISISSVKINAEIMDYFLACVM